MDIFFAVNDAYAMQLTVAIVSVLENNKDGHIVFHVLSRDFSTANKERLEKLRIRYHNFTMVYHAIDEKLFADCNISIDYITIETYFRYAIAELCPDLDKALYLDADLVINRSLQELYNCDIEGYYCAGVSDLYIQECVYKKTIGLSEMDAYVNAGVLLLNLRKMRENKIFGRLMKNTVDLADQISYQDQDIINITFKGNIKTLDSIYNFTSHNVGAERYKRRKAAIIHYTGPDKPWNENCRHKMRKYWEKYYRISKELVNKKIKILVVDDVFESERDMVDLTNQLRLADIEVYLLSVKKDGILQIRRPGQSVWIDVPKLWVLRWLFVRKEHIDVAILEVCDSSTVACDTDIMKCFSNYCEGGFEKDSPEIRVLKKTLWEVG